MPRSSSTGYYELFGTPNDSDQETSYGAVGPVVATSQDATPEATPSNAAHEPRSRAQRTLRYVRKKWRQRRSREEIRNTLPTFRPWFTFTVALVNVGLFAAVCITDGITDIRFTPRQVHGLVRDLDNQQVPRTRQEPANFFIGPTAVDLVHHGAKYSTVIHLLLSYPTYTKLIL